MHRSGMGRLWSLGAALGALALIAPAAEAIVTVGTVKTPTPNSRPTATAVAPNGVIWFTEEAANKLGYINPNTGFITEYTWTTQNVRPNAIAIDNSGRIWFTEYNANRIGMYNPATNYLVEYYWGGVNLGLSGIEVTSDGKVWFTMYNRNQIGVLDPGRLTIRYYAWTSASIGPLRIKKDVYNRLWFTENLANRVGVLDPYWNYVYDYYYAGANAGPWGIDVDTNGKVWFTENLAGTFSRLDPNTGVINEWLAVGGFSSRPRDIDTHRNPSGQTVVVWAESAGPGNIGVLNAATGNKIGVPLSPSSEATGVAVDAQRNVWFTETGLWQVGGFNLGTTGIARRPTPSAPLITAPDLDSDQEFRVILTQNGNGNGNDKEDKGKNRDKQAKIEKHKAKIDKELPVTEVKEHTPKEEKKKYK
jgi:virginiamycin B lyase